MLAGHFWQLKLWKWDQRESGCDKRIMLEWCMHCPCGKGDNLMKGIVNKLKFAQNCLPDADGIIKFIFGPKCDPLGPNNNKAALVQVIAYYVLSRRQTKTWFSFDPMVGVIKVPFLDFSVREIFTLARAYVRLFKSHSHLTCFTAAELRWYVLNISVIVR